MVSQEDRQQLLDDALARVLPESRHWVRGSDPADTAPPGAPRSYWLEVISPLHPGRYHLVVLLRQDGDIQVEYHIAGKQGSPFEALFVLDDGEGPAVVDEVARFVKGLVSEQLMLAYERGFARGGRRFLTTEALAEGERSRFRWVASWQGTYDWQL